MNTLKADLSSKFICGNEQFCTVENFVNAPYIRKTFEIENFNSAKIYVCGLGFYRIFINGKEITKGLLSPYISNSDDVIFYDYYDLTNELKTGKNSLCFILGNGMQNAMGGHGWKFDEASFRSSPKVAFNLYLDDVLKMEADETFKWKESPIIYDDLRYGEHYDANLEIDGWADIDFDDSDWKNCTFAVTPKAEKRVSTVSPILKYREIKPVRIFKSDNGYIYDFGYNSAGLCKLKVKGTKGQKITLRFGEIINDGKLNIKNICGGRANLDLIHKDVYYCSGKGVEEYEPSFTYHGFQYVYVEGITEKQATEELLTFNLYTSNFEKLTEFNCSDEIVNKLQAMCDNSNRSNFFHIVTDCPQREKNGWTGDVAISIEQMLLNYDCAHNFREWMHNVRKAQREDGALPGVVPTTGYGFAWGNGPGWDAVVSLVPYYVYKFTGDKEILEENADAIYKYLKYMYTKIDGKVLCYGLGDWCEVMARIPSTPEYFTDTAICYNICKKAEFIFELLGKKEELEYTKELSSLILDFLRRGFLTKRGLSIVETQTAYAMLVEYDVLTEEEKPLAAKRLAELIRLNNYNMRAGIFGARLMFHVLSKYGYNDLALKVITDTNYPGYGEWVKKGQTSLWERFQQTDDRDDGEIWQVNGAAMDSLNHHFFGDISQWFMRNIVGINVNPEVKNHNHIVIKPEFFTKIENASGSYKRGNNKVSVSWKKIGENINLAVENVGDFVLEYDLKNFEIVEKKEDGNKVEFKLLHK